MSAPARPVALRPLPSPADGGSATPQPGELRLVSVLVVVVVLTQRVGIPFGGSVISVALPLTYLFVGFLLVRRLLVVNQLRAELLTLAISACLLTTAAVTWLGATRELSMSSLFFLVAIYLLWVFRVRDPYGAAVVARAGRTFVLTMVGLAALGTAQLVGQWTGVWEWEDYLAQVVPDAYRIPDFNYNNELAYGVGVYKGTAFVLLEPSFLSQLCALAILVGMVLGVRAWQVLVLGCGLAAAVSGTGLILLGAGAVLLLARMPRRLRPSYVITGGTVAAVLLLSPVADFLLDRQSEFGTSGSSANSRFVAPYREAWEGLVAEPVRFLVGAGPGSVDRLINGTPIGMDILYGTLPKLLFEYGILAGGLFLLFLVFAVLDRTPWRVVPGSVLVMIFLLSGALLQPQTAVLAWLLTGIGTSEGRRAPASR
ncbi:hypothetical protein JOD57_002856 [Geodermatophilus bullaregiensis]|uniref:hypothetical protein n=1 Tax=Geodermatophilus bullaregiensis TaxID=1564160 RepID=UPI001955FC68|nr:hypothetical protein [Geodermatophilus bullaregiensis]MBM7807019.1 hypothetical protein [Geodermatophilus bullaregiensis]